DQVHNSILAQGSLGYPRHRATRGVGVLCLKRAIAITQKHRNAFAAGDGHIDLSIAVEIASHHGNRSFPRSVGFLRLEGSISLAQQYAYVVAALVDDNDVLLAISVKVGLEHENRVRTDRIADRRCKGSIALADEDLESRAIQCSKIGFPVAVEVSCRDEVGSRAQLRA